MSEKLSKIFDVESVDVVDNNQVVIPGGETEEVDFDYARANYYKIIDASQAAINTAIRIAAESENPRAIEVLSGLLKNAADINKQLVQMSKDKQDVKIAKKTAKSDNTLAPQIGHQQNIVFTGNAADLAKLLANKQ